VGRRDRSRGRNCPAPRHCCQRHGVAHWTGGPPASSSSPTRASPRSTSSARNEGLHGRGRDRAAGPTAIPTPTPVRRCRPRLRARYARRAGPAIFADRALESVRGAIDTLVVVGGDGAEDAVRRPEARRLGSQRAASRSRRGDVGVQRSVSSSRRRGCSTVGGRRRTGERVSGWHAPYPLVTVEPDPILRRGRQRLGRRREVTAGMGPRARARRSRSRPRGSRCSLLATLVLFRAAIGRGRRNSARSSAHSSQRADPLRELQISIAEHPDDDYRVERLASRVADEPRGTSPRVFRAEVGCPPAVYVERNPGPEVARRLLENDRSLRRRRTPAPPRRLRHRRGRLRRAFGRRVGASPSDYRDRFRPAGLSAGT